MANRLLSIRDAADCLGVKEKTVRNWVYEGKIDSVKLLGGSVRISENTLEYIIVTGTRPRRRR